MSARQFPKDWRAISGALGDKVRTHRLDLGWTQEQLAEAAGVSRNQVQNIEHNRNNQAGTGNPQLTTLIALADALQLEVSYLVDHKQPTRATPH